MQVLPHQLQSHESGCGCFEGLLGLTDMSVFSFTLTFLLILCFDIIQDCKIVIIQLPVFTTMAVFLINL